ncbi:hypothetical protein TKK_0000739 [Trichogramma kaykai]|uniref:Uncharacterized protein n=1 Tax=Trichogramma kaykai TaxID=54128 RepID=A0ABD2WQ71_9HYME
MLKGLTELKNHVIFLAVSVAEAWSTRTYCCKEDGCNSAPTTSRLGLGASLLLTLVALPAASAAVARPLHG